MQRLTKRQNDQGELLCDLSAAGIPTVEGSLAVKMPDDSLRGEGIWKDDLLLFNPNEPKVGRVVAVQHDDVLSVRRCGPDDIPHVVGVAVGYVRNLRGL